MPNLSRYLNRLRSRLRLAKGVAGECATEASLVFWLLPLLPMLRFIWTFERRVPSWLALRPLATNAIVRSSYFWLFAVPIAARTLSVVESPVLISVFGQEFRLVLNLPFSWKVLYSGAICAALARIVFAWRCPGIIQSYKTYADFVTDGESEFVIKEGLIECLESLNDVPAMLLVDDHPKIKSLVPEFAERHVDFDRDTLPEHRFTEQRGSEESEVLEGPFVSDWLAVVRQEPLINKSDAFHDVRRLVSWIRTLSRCSCTLLFAGFGATMAWITIESMLWVFGYH